MEHVFTLSNTCLPCGARVYLIEHMFTLDSTCRARVYLIKHVSVLHELVEQQDHDVGFSRRHGPRGGSQFRAFSQEADDNRGVPAADSPVQRPHPVMVNVLNGRAPVH